MIRTLGLLAFSFSLSFSHAQDVVSIDYLMGTPVKVVERYEVDELKDSTKVYLPFDFAASDMENERFIDSIISEDKPIAKIDFVYTKFRVSEDFDQEQLNRERLELLRRNAPFIFDNNVIEWSFYEQSNAMGLDENKTLFHGFVIHYLSHPMYLGNDGLSTEEEIDAIYDYLKDIKRPETVREIRGIATYGGRYLPILKRKREAGKRYPKKLFGIWRKKEEVWHDTSWVERSIAGFYRPFGEDTVVTKTLRNYEDKWNCNYVVEDVTGSMYPYIAQTLAWKKLKMDESGIEHFVFFNDGDRRPDGPIGKSGGAYYINSNDFDEVGKFITDVMHKGGGGAAPENNAEATIYAESEFDESDSYILIADNNAPVRDMIIADEIKKPTHVILCGVFNGRIHHTYINLALNTGGTLHTIEEDITDIGKLKSGDTFKMGGQKWRFISRGKIELVH